MRIGIEAQRIFRPNKHGMDIVALETIRHLVRVAPEHTVVVFVRPDADPCLRPASNLEIREVEARSYPTWEQWALPRAVQAANVDVLHCTSNTAPVRPGVPLILTLHDIIFLEGRAPWRRPGTWYQRLGNTYRRGLVPLALQQAHTIVTVSEYERQRIAARFPEWSDRLAVVHNGLSSRFRPITEARSRATVRQRYDLPERFLLFLGNTDPKKNVPNVLEAYVRFLRSAPAPAQRPLVIADFDRDRLMQHLRRLEAVDLSHWFHLPGYIAHNDLPALYSQADVFLYPSLRESFGMPILEAMACGTPVVTSDAASMPEVAGDAAFLVDPHDPAHMAQTLHDAMTHPNRRAERAERGIERAASFSWTSAAERLLPLYHAAAGVALPA